jgi:hypothetical protein
MSNLDILYMGNMSYVPIPSRLSHEIAKPVQSADTFFELSYDSYLENFLDSRYFIHANQKKTPQMGIYILLFQSIKKKLAVLGFNVLFFFTKINNPV